ncbi:MAG: PRC-barrel domain-containing protein [Victivallaceae bacterium]|nr:PRC-barrel domain-containing protein [Victivallaceae bacterium]
MRKNLHGMFGFSILALDGELGKVKDFYFDDENWTLRYLVVQTGSWLLGRKVLISFASVTGLDWEAGAFSVNLSCEQVRNSPDIDTEKPVCRQHELELHEHYMLPAYWINAPGIVWGIDNYPFAEIPEPEEEKEAAKREVPASDDRHLRSVRQIIGYLIHATDGEIGHVKDFIVEVKNWTVTFLLVDTRSLLAGRKVLLPTEKIKRLEWDDSEVYVNVSREFIINSPEFDLDKDL